MRVDTETVFLVIVAVILFGLAVELYDYINNRYR